MLRIVDGGRRATPEETMALAADDFYPKKSTRLQKSDQRRVVATLAFFLQISETRISQWAPFALIIAGLSRGSAV